MQPIYQDRSEEFKLMISVNNNYQAHLHSTVEVTLILGGSIKITIMGTEYVLNAGDIAVVFPNQMHSTKTEEMSQILMVFFDINLLHDYQVSFNKKIPGEPVLRKGAYPDELYNVIQSLYNISNSTIQQDKYTIALDDYKGDVRFRDAHLNLIAGFLLPLIKLKDGDKTTIEADTFKKVIAYLNKHYHENVTLERVAKALGFNKYYISHLFSEKMEISFKEYINQRRVYWACNKLLSTSYSITYIAYESGFSNIRTFYRAFHKYTGQTPTEYRETNGKN